MLDSEIHQKMESLSNLCFNQLASMQIDHKESLSTIQNKMEVCLDKGYMVNFYASLSTTIAR